MKTAYNIFCLVLIPFGLATGGLANVIYRTVRAGWLLMDDINNALRGDD